MIRNLVDRNSWTYEVFLNIFFVIGVLLMLALIDKHLKTCFGHNCLKRLE